MKFNSYWFLFAVITVLIPSRVDGNQHESSISTTPATTSSMPSIRPPLAERTFVSPLMDNLISSLTPLFKDKDLATLFSNCFPNTLDTTIFFHSPPENADDLSSLDSFVITGDIPALWLRDSTNQVIPYLPYGPKDSSLQYLFEGLISRQAKSINIDSFANSFNFNASGDGHQDDVRTPAMSPSVFEGKYEIDSLCAFLKLSYWQWKFSGDLSLQRFASSIWLDAVAKTLSTSKPYILLYY